MQRMPVRSARGVVPASLPNQSLSQWLHDLKSQTDVQHDTIGAIYDAQFRRHFGRPSWRRSSDRDNATLAKVQSWCAERGVDPEDFIAANMLLLKHRLGRHSFRPNMLLGTHAEARYNGVLGRANRRFQTGSTRVFDARETWLGRIRVNLMTSELDVAELFVSLELAGRPISWRDAAVSVETNKDWRDFQDQIGCYNEIRKLHGEPAVKREGLLARFSAAWQLAERHRHGLGDCIGVTDFSWPAFVRVLRLVRDQAAERPKFEPAVEAGGRLWGNW